jgi:indole-3-glycerol phosphate synthase
MGDKTILHTLSDKSFLRVAEAKKKTPLENLKAEAEKLTDSEKSGIFPFEAALKKPELSFICEVKKASPSKGVIAEDFPYLEIAADYENGGAEAISVLTEPEYFLGDLRYLNEISNSVKIPTLRKDFIVDEYQIYEAKICGAAAVLLIVSILSESDLRRFSTLAEMLGMSALVEAHDEREIELAAGCGAKIIGVNNRNLKDFSVDTANAAKLRGKVPPGVLFVFESGVRDKTDIVRAREINADAVLIGEALMRAADRTAFLRELKNYAD